MDRKLLTGATKAQPSSVEHVTVGSGVSVATSVKSEPTVQTSVFNLELIDPSKLPQVFGWMIVVRSLSLPRGTILPLGLLPIFGNSAPIIIGTDPGTGWQTLRVKGWKIEPRHLAITVDVRSRKVTAQQCAPSALIRVYDKGSAAWQPPHASAGDQPSSDLACYTLPDECRLHLGWATVLMFCAHGLGAQEQ